MTVLNLEKIINVKCYLIHAEISRYTEIAYITPILLHIQEQQGKSTTVDVLANTLFKKSKIISQRLLDKCEEYKLVSKNDNQKYYLTKEGRITIDKKKFFKTEKGMWKIHHTVDSLIPEDHRILKIEHMTSYELRKKRYHISSYNITDELRSLQHFEPIMLSNLNNDPISFHINNILSDKIIKIDLDDEMKKFKVDLKIDKNESWILLGKEKLSCNNNITYDSVIEKTIDDEYYYYTWDKEHQHLLVEYSNNMDPEECITMRKTLTLKPKFDDYGQFESIEHAVNICPKDEYNAQKWANRMFKEKILEHVKKNRKQWEKPIKDKFPGMTIKFDSEKFLIDDSTEAQFF